MGSFRVKAWGEEDLASVDSSDRKGDQQVLAFRSQIREFSGALCTPTRPARRSGLCNAERPCLLPFNVRQTANGHVMLFPGSQILGETPLAYWLSFPDPPPVVPPPGSAPGMAETWVIISWPVKPMLRF